MKPVRRSDNSDNNHASAIAIAVAVLATVFSNARIVTSKAAHKAHAIGLKRVVLSLVILLGVPHLYWLHSIPAETILVYLQQLNVTWDAALHTSMWLIIIVLIPITLYFSHLEGKCGTPVLSFKKVTTLGVLLPFTIVVIAQVQVIAPSILWNPFLQQSFEVYYPHRLPDYLQGICINDTNIHANRPLCLSRESWLGLSSNAIDSRNKDDVSTVMNGIQYARSKSGGLIVNVLSRDTSNSIPALRFNVEALVPFFEGKLSVVIFENDSIDGSRGAFKAWAKEASGYKVDLISCGNVNPDCKFGISHRYDSTEYKNYFQSSAIGKMADFRQNIVDYILGNPDYDKFSHMIVIDMDIGVSLSPFGILHTLGKETEVAVASSGRQTLPGSLGTLIPPYDYSAFRAIKTGSNSNLLQLHSLFCGIMPPGDRWRNQCDAVSPMHSILVIGSDRLNKDDLYPVESAFNGATLYPLRLIRESGARYDVGDDGQRCEHIGFNTGLRNQMYVNPKWNLHLAPDNPGGPTGVRALKNVIRITLNPRLASAVGAQLILSYCAFVYSIMTLVHHALYPLLVKLRVMNTPEYTLPLVDKQPLLLYRYLFRLPPVRRKTRNM